MDTEAQMLLEDLLTFCERDQREPRLINMLRQCGAVELSDEALTLEAPSRFAAAYLAKQQGVIEQYLEEITFAPLALIVVLPHDDAALRDAAARGAGEKSTPNAGAANSPARPAPREAARTFPEHQAAAEGAGERTPFSPTNGSAGGAGFSPAATAERALYAGVEETEGGPSFSPAGQTKPPAERKGPQQPAVPAHHVGTWETAAYAGEDAAPHAATVRNAVSPADFQRLVAQMNGGQPAARTRRGGAATRKAEPEPEPAGAAVAINSKFTFESFVLGDENKLAYQSALRFAVFAEQPGTSDALFIYGHSGLGKTHLLLAIKNELAKDKPHLRVKYANSQAYIDDYMRSLAELKQDGNKIILQEYHDADVLIIDDIQNIIGKQSTIEQFFQLVDEFLRQNKKIAIASDRAPKELAMDERLTSRFNSGMLCLVSEPGFETKYAILKHYYETTILGHNNAAYANVDADLLQSLQMENGKLTDEQLRYMAEISGNNIRELESFCERCSHDAREKELAGTELTGDDIQEIANQYFDTAQKVIRVNTVQAVVEEFYQVAHKDLVGRKRTSNIASARHMAIYLTYELCSLSLNAIGAAFGGRDHATVINSIKVIEKRMGEDAQVADDCQRLRSKIQLRS